jgi:hypothetical protein
LDESRPAEHCWVQLLSLQSSYSSVWRRKENDIHLEDPKTIIICKFFKNKPTFLAILSRSTIIHFISMDI